MDELYRRYLKEEEEDTQVREILTDLEGKWWKELLEAEQRAETGSL